MVERGVIQHRARRLQIADMSGLRFGNITPTDWDIFLDFDNRLFVIGEAKFNGADVPGGQLLAMRRLLSATHQPPRRYAFGIIADHFHPEHEDIDSARMLVRSIWQNGEFKQPLQRGLTVRSAIDLMVSYVENKHGRPLYRRAHLVEPS